jgi:cbb3-type cytochrome oxidase subunit 3
MDFSRFMDGILSFAQNHVIIVIVLALVLLYFMYRKPKLVLGILLLGLFLVGLLYFITSMSRSGSEQEKRLFREDEKQLDTNR